MGDKELIKAILHYQQCLDKYTQRNDEARVLYCLSKLYKMPINIGHLQDTGVGRTVNALRKHNGEIGEAAKALVGKWKEMVAADGEETDAKENSKSESIKNNESKDKHKGHKEKSGSSHRDSEKKKSRSNSTSEEDSKYSSKKVKEETKHRHRESSNSKKNKDKHEKHKSSKRKRSYSSDESDKEESDYETHDHKRDDRSRSSSSEESDVKPEKKRKHSKRDSSLLNDENHEYSKSKRKKYSESEESEEEPELIEKRHSYKSSRQHEKKEKSKHEHKKDKKERRSESKSRKDDKKSKEKHPSASTSKSSSKSDKDVKDKVTKSDKKSKHSSSKNSDQNKKSTKTSDKTGRSMGENGIGSGSGASFAEALGMLMPSSSKVSKKKVAVIHPLAVDNPSSQSRESSPEVAPSQIPDLLSPKKLSPLDIKVDNLLPEITPNYRPVGFPIDNGMLKNKLTSEDETLSAIMYNKISRTKVYSGNKVAWGKVPSLFEICTRVLQDNIDALEYTGGVPYIILKPVIERANPDQLFMLEHHNPYLIEDTDELWQLHCNKEFRNKKREEMETWRDMYMRCLDEREAKLRALTANIKQSQDKSLPVRQTKLAYVDSFVKPPRNIARKQAKHGTGGVEKKPAITPSSRLNVLATSGAAGQISVPNPGTRAVSSSGSSTAVVKPKKAPLMQKTLALMKSRIFRR